MPAGSWTQLQSSRQLFGGLLYAGNLDVAGGDLDGNGNATPTLEYFVPRPPSLSVAQARVTTAGTDNLGGIMHPQHCTPFLPLLAALALACAGETSDPASPTAGGPQFRTENNADGPGAFAIRSPTTNAFLFTTPESNLTVISGLSLDQAAILCAGGDFTFEPAEQLVVVRPDGTTHVNLQASDATLLVYPGFFADFCATAPLAVGTGKFIYTDNDAVFSGTRSDAFRFQVEGDAVGPDGQRYHVVSKIQDVASREGVLSVKVYEVRVTPVGG